MRIALIIFLTAWINILAGQNLIDSAEVFVEKGFNNYKNKDYKNASIYFGKAKQIYLSNQDTVKFLKNTHRQGVCKNKEGGYNNSLIAKYVLDSIVLLSEKYSPLIDLFYFFEYLGVANLNAGYINEAKTAFQKSINYAKAFEKTKDKTTLQLADGYRWMAVFYNRIDQEDSSLIYAEKSFEVVKSLTHLDNYHTYLLESQVNLALNHRNIDNYEEALHYINNAELVAKDNTKVNHSLKSIYNIKGTIYDAKGEYKKAEKYYDLALNACNESNCGIERIEIYSNYSSLYYRLGKYKEAIQFGKQALSLGEKTPINFEKKADIYNSIGVAYYKDKELILGKDYLEKSLNTVKKFAPNSASLARRLNNIAIVYSNNNQNDLALKKIQEALIINVIEFNSSNFKNNPDVVISTKLNKDYLLKSLYLKAEILYRLAISQKDTNYTKSALSTILTADTLLTHARLEFLFETNKLQYTKKTRGIYPLAVKICYLQYKETLNIEYLRTAFKYSEKTKAQVLLNEINQKEQLFNSGVSLSEIEKYKQNQIVIRKLNNELKHLLQDEKRQAEAMLLNKRIGTLLTQTQFFHTKFSQKLKRQLFPHISSASEVQALLKKDEALIQYTMDDKNLYIFLLKKDSLTCKNISIDEDFKDEIENFKALLFRAPKIYSDSTYKIYNKLIYPIKQHLEKIIKITIIPHNSLNEVYFDALVSRNLADKNIKQFTDLHYLIDDFDVLYHYSASLWVTSRKLKDYEDIFFLGFAPLFSHEPTTYENGRKVILEHLIHSEKEMLEIDKIYQKLNLSSHLFLGSSSISGFPNTQTLKSNIIQYSTHSIKGNGLLKILLLDSLNNIKSFTRNDLYLYPFFDCNLVIFNSCKSGRGNHVGGEGVMSIARPILYSGVPNVLMTLIEVYDKPSSELMINFHKYVSEGISFSEAINKSKRDIRSQKGMHPANWGSYIYIGSN